ncbi:hypothetical protein [Croceimicrobium sp.]|uniref:hypothetical protein n=1 Tax=Croceimicrobium sp. TaxID=2828340 RepID=UPI003BA92012
MKLEDKKGLIISFIGFLVGGYLVYISFRTKPFKGAAVDSVFTISNFRSIRSGTSVYFRFNCNGKEVEEHGGSKDAFTIIGEKYHGVYDQQDCENFRIDYNRPLFLPKEKTNIVLGRILNVRESTIFYEIRVEGTKYEKLQFMEEGYREKYPEIDKGADFPVEYWLRNPQRSIMRFN